jgi:hypothetical protein
MTVDFAENRSIRVAGMVCDHEVSMVMQRVWQNIAVRCSDFGSLRVMAKIHGEAFSISVRP